MENAKTIDQPLREFSQYDELNNQIIDKHFEYFVEKSNINVEENIEQVKKIDKTQAKLASVNYRLKGLKTGSIFNIIGIVGSSIAAIVGLALVIMYANSPKSQMFIGGIISLLLGITLFVLLLVNQILNINKKINSTESEKSKVEKLLSDEKETAYNQTLPLRLLFKQGTKFKILSESLPLIKFNRSLKMSDIENLRNKYDYEDTPYNVEKMATYIQSGSIYGNPFIIKTEKSHEIIDKTYHGSLTIHYTVTHRNYDGKITQRTVTEVLRAQVVKPYPLFTDTSWITFFSMAAPNLSFSRDSQKIHKLSEKEQKSLVKKTQKEIDKRKKKDHSFTALANTKFEAYWNAPNRDNELEFRLLFTPLAQQNLCDLLENTKIGVGDTFSMYKNKKVTEIFHDELQDINLIDDQQEFYEYSFNIIKEKFYKFNKECFRKIYWSFAPYFSIPIYQQTKDFDWEFDKSSNSPLSEWEIESQINLLPRKLFDHPNTKTQSILKTARTIKGENIEESYVYSLGYDIIERIDYVPVRGGDGKIHHVPVHWDEYIEKPNKTKIELVPFENQVVDEDWEEKNKKFITDDSYISSGSIIKVLSSNLAQ